MSSRKKSVIIGSNTSGGYAYLAANRLKNNDHPIVPIGIRQGEVAGEEILDLRSKPHVEDVDTVTLYINPIWQKEWEDYILSLNPKRIIFNPGTENPGLVKKAQDRGIETVYGCTLVMLSAGTY